jgi:hypothetical protein
MVTRVAEVVLILLFAVSFSTRAQSFPVPDEGQSVVPSKDYSCTGKGDRSVFGRFIDPLTGKGIWGAKVYLIFNNYADPDDYVTDREGKYCIHYSDQKVRTTLLFDYQGTSCVAGISGSESHYINKLLDSACSRVTGQAVALPTGIGPFRDLPKGILPVQLRLTNETGSAIQILSTTIQPTGTMQTNNSTSLKPGSEIQPTDISPIDPALVATAAVAGRTGISVLRIGRFSLFNLSHSGDDSSTLILKLGLRDNEIIPQDSAVTKVIFIAKELLPQPKDTGLPETQVGNVVIRANRIFVEGQTDLASSERAHRDSEDRPATLGLQSPSATLSLVIPLERGVH